MPTRTDLPELDDLLPIVDVIDVKTARGAVSLREFTAGALGHGPLWIKALFGVRILLAWALRLETAVPDSFRLRPETVSFTPGDPASFFTVVRGEEDHYLLLKVSDNHLVAWLAIITDNGRPAEFKVVTLVKYLRPVGRFYYNLIRPFHHLVLLSMCRAGETSFASR
ncbi:DUF2867 domain-containing protein [Kribbella sp. NBC_01484]|uniref:DUF2867 domain-containing protein n=1 Tax=Kribbella sp. NBC_01484 TaxID=2903579 RepID=UPI002E308854|nr:DUF2867 domain-containing protein [Kribbella sp. NBC_01484]